MYIYVYVHTCMNKHATLSIHIYIYRWKYVKSARASLLFFLFLQGLRDAITDFEAS